MLVWRKLTSAKWEDAWLERLSFLDAWRLAIFSLPGARTIRIEAYGLTQAEAGALVQRFGGQMRELKGRDLDAAAHHGAGLASREPLRIRDRLLIVRSETERAVCEARFPRRRALVIPAAMAFGTGDHATTATCLRMLCDVAAARPAGGWESLDLGTGTGILALAARALGATRAEAWDFDPACVRTARANLSANGVDRVRVAKVDVTRWQPKRPWDVITANLYSEVLIKAAPQIAAALAPGGALLLSGILRTQEHEVIAAFQRPRRKPEHLPKARRPAAADDVEVGFHDASPEQPQAVALTICQIVRRGKWVTIRAERVGNGR